jgi:hypothetical protein
LLSIDRETGLRANPVAGCDHVVVEAFVSGTEPTELCTRAHHRRLAMPYPVHRFPINEQGEIEISGDELDRLMATDLSLTLSASGRELVAFTANGRLSMAIRRVPGTIPTPLPAGILERFDPSTWTGKDGRPATVELVHR